MLHEPKRLSPFAPARNEAAEKSERAPLVSPPRNPRSRHVGLGAGLPSLRRLPGKSVQPGPRQEGTSRLHTALGTHWLLSDCQTVDG